MAKTALPPLKSAKARSSAKGGYRKGEETRQRILEAGLRAFGEAAFKSVTTRHIAAAADVSLPTLQYYFDDKEGLYRACAEAIVESYRRHMAGTAATAAALTGDCASGTARAHLKAVIGALAGFLVGSHDAEGWAPFVARELRDPGPAFEILYERLWRPGVDLIAQLISRILGVAEDNAAARIQALLLISSALAFQSGRRIVLRSLHWSKIGPNELAMVVSALDAQIDAIGPHISS